VLGLIEFDLCVTKATLMPMHMLCYGGMTTVVTESTRLSHLTEHIVSLQTPQIENSTLHEALSEGSSRSWVCIVDK
jgi:hypothetical protein